MWDSIISGITAVNDFVNGIVWGWPVIILILGTGILLTVRTKFLQVRKFKDSLNTTIVPTVKSIGNKEKKTKKGAVSQFEAFATAISGTVGTGNIVGVTTAVLTGGPGAVFWMWVSAFFGMVTNYAENVLGLYFRKKADDGTYRGGAFYYIYYGLKWKWLAYIAAVFTVLAAIGMSGVQTNKISSSLTQAFQFSGTIPNLIVGIIVAILVALIILGGIKRISKVAATLVPFMSILFMVLAIVSICMHITNLPNAFALIFTSIFSFKSVASGAAGYAFAQIIQKGMARGVFSNEAGLGSSVIAHSASDTKEPVKQGLWGIFEVFFDTFVVCTLTALMLLTSVDVTTIAEGADDVATIMGVFSGSFGVFGTVCYAIILPLFAFTTIMAWSYYGEKAIEFLCKNLKDKTRKIIVLVFKIIYIGLIVASAIITSDLVWSISDTFMGLLALPHLICLLALSGLIVKITNNYFARKKAAKINDPKAEPIEPMLSAYPELNKEFKDNYVD